MAKNYTPNQNNRQAYDTLTEGAATLPPQAVELEEAVLGALMLEGDSITTASSTAPLKSSARKTSRWTCLQSPRNSSGRKN